jgi:hypothetical protein
MLARERLRDAVALQDEDSHVDAAARQRIGEIILEAENEELGETARRLVERLSPAARRERTK